MLLSIKIVEQNLSGRDSDWIRVGIWADEDGGKQSRTGETEDSSTHGLFRFVQTSPFPLLDMAMTLRANTLLSPLSSIWHDLRHPTVFGEFFPVYKPISVFIQLNELGIHGEGGIWSKPIGCAGVC